MFADGYFSLSFAEAVGFVVTIVSVYLIVRQLNETKLASQMEGIMQLGDRFTQILPYIQTLSDLTSSQD